MKVSECELYEIILSNVLWLVLNLSAEYRVPCLVEWWTLEQSCEDLVPQHEGEGVQGQVWAPEKISSIPALSWEIWNQRVRVWRSVPPSSGLHDQECWYFMYLCSMNLKLFLPSIKSDLIKSNWKIARYFTKFQNLILSHCIGCLLAEVIRSKFISVQLDHPVEIYQRKLAMNELCGPFFTKGSVQLSS